MAILQTHNHLHFREDYFCTTVSGCSQGRVDIVRVCMRKRACAYVCVELPCMRMRACLLVYTQTCIQARCSLCMGVRMYVRTCLCAYVRLCAYVCTGVYGCVRMYGRMYMYVCVYVRVSVRAYVCVRMTYGVCVRTPYAIAITSRDQECLAILHYVTWFKVDAHPPSPSL